MSCNLRNFVDDSIHPCRNTSLELRFITLKDFTSSIPPWTIIRKRLCELLALSSGYPFINCVNFRVTCVYLSCKVEEFNVSAQQFVANCKGDQQKAMNIILSNELLLMKELNYNLTIHNPFRPVEGFLIDIKTRCHIPNPDRLRKGIDDFLDKSFSSDACLIYAPSQIALAAVLHAASKEQENLDSYVTDSLFANATHMLKSLIEGVRSKF